MIRTKRIHIALLIAAAVLSLTACVKPAGDPLDGTAWTLDAYRKTSPLPGTTITLAFEDGQISGSAGCNSYGGSYQVAGDKIEIGQVFMTEMACMNPQGIMEQESTYLAALGSAQTYELVNGRLTITYSDHETLTFDPQ